MRPPPWVKDFSDESVQIDYVPLLPEEIEKRYNSAELGGSNDSSPEKQNTQTAEGTIDSFIPTQWRWGSLLLTFDEINWHLFPVLVCEKLIGSTIAGSVTFDLH